MVQFRRFFGAVVALVAGFFFVKVKYDLHRREAHRVDIVLAEVLRRLQKQHKLSRASAEIPPYVGSIQLRDLILSKEHNLKRKLDLWKKVSNKVEHNTNVRTQSIENYGDIMKVWQWISDLDT